MRELTVKQLFEDKRKDFALSLVTEPHTINKRIVTPYFNRPGLALAGWLEVFTPERIQIFGEAEVRYLQSLKEQPMLERLRELFKMDIPCVIISKGLSLPPSVEYLANDLNIPIFSSRLSTVQLISQINRYLMDVFALEKTIHATLVDVFGLGILITGKSGIGKSECALDLISRGHSLVGDDMINMRNLNDTIVGRSGREFGHFMEIRGVGVVNVEKMFGIERVRREKTIDLQIELMPWQENTEYERIGLKANYVDHLGVKLPMIYLPISPGKNVSVIVEVAAMNQILKGSGYDAAEDFNRKIHEEIRKQTLFKKVQATENDPKDGNSK
ncbi:MAG TPA: HPr(Ser) kinase/phosphatase [Candidatus Cloacimonadota bacterium]|nr:HPr(Ser) kinase/phosphatase [Candidatus Cloacimonadota bacterium]